MQKLPDDRRLMMKQPVSHASLLRQHRLQGVDGMVVAHPFRRRQ